MLLEPSVPSSQYGTCFNEVFQCGFPLLKLIKTTIYLLSCHPPTPNKAVIKNSIFQENKPALQELIAPHYPTTITSLTVGTQML